MGGGGGQKTTKTEIDPDVKRRFLDLYSQAQDVAAQPFQLYTADRFAPLNADQQAALGQLRGNAGLLSGALPGALDALQGGLDPSIRDVSTQPITSLNTAQFLNPFTDAVINTGLSDLDRARQMAIGQGEDQALAAGAFGGSRQGVADSLTNEAFARQAADLSANLRQQGFSQAQQTAQQLATGNATRALQAQQLNQGADLNRAQLANQVAGGLVNLGLGGAGLLGQAGDVLQQQAQRPLDFAYQQFLAQQAEGARDIGLLNSVLSGIPGGGGTVTQPGGSAAAGFLGGALGGAQIGSGFGPWGAVAGGIGGGLLGIL